MDAGSPEGQVGQAKGKKRRALAITTAGEAAEVAAAVEVAVFGEKVAWG